MGTLAIPRRLSHAILTSLGAGVVPRIGLEYITVGRKQEISALLADLKSIEEGGAGFRFIVGSFGSGKSFMLQVLRNYAMEQGFVVADADLSPERKLAGREGQAVATYRELMRHLATKVRPEGGALPVLLERWIADVQLAVRQDTGLESADPRFVSTVETRIMATVGSMSGLVHGYDFATVLAAYWRGHVTGEEGLKDSALRWLRGEFATKADAQKALGVRVIIDDSTWYDYVKLMASFVARVGYKGLIVVIDEAINLYKLQHSGSRQANYEMLLAMFNDTMQGKALHLGVLVGGTPAFVEDPRRGLFSYDALKSRLEEGRFVVAGRRDLSGPLIRLPALTAEEQFVLLQRLAAIHQAYYVSESVLGDAQLQQFLAVIHRRVGANQLLTPREIARSFIHVLNLLHQNPDLTFEQVVVADASVLLDPLSGGDEGDEGDGEAKFAEFKL